MLHINLAALEGQSFYKDDPNTQYVCVGYGQNPETGANYLVGSSWDQANNRTTIGTFLFREVTFIGQLKVAKAP